MHDPTIMMAVVSSANISSKRVTAVVDVVPPQTKSVAYTVLAAGVSNVIGVESVEKRYM